ncbi:MAG: ribose-phosphate pyrophosphokinase [Chloroflexi bacterium]|nr:ribose-phosphate pyrophosphokinase [Chloroflexota bacterium]
MQQELLIFSGRGNSKLSQDISDRLNIPLGDAIVNEYKDGETSVQLRSDVRGADVYIIQPTCAPVNQNLVELLIMLDAAKRASAKQITAVIPYYGYARQERKTAPREPISAKLVANLVTVAGANRILTIDLHAPAIEGFFDIPVDHLRAEPLLADRIRSLNLSNMVIVAPDEGAVDRAAKMGERLNAPLAILLKHRPRPDVAEVRGMVGEVRGCVAILLDDLISTGGTTIQAAEFLLRNGAKDVIAAATHPVFANIAWTRLAQSPISHVLVTDTIPLPKEALIDKVEVCSVAPLLAEAILRIHQHRSVSALFR